LPKSETSEELFPRVLQGGLYAINGRNRHGDAPHSNISTLK